MENCPHKTAVWLKTKEGKRTLNNNAASWNWLLEKIPEVYQKIIKFCAFAQSRMKRETVENCCTSLLRWNVCNCCFVKLSHCNICLLVHGNYFQINELTLRNRKFIKSATFNETIFLELYINRVNDYCKCKSGTLPNIG